MNFDRSPIAPALTLGLCLVAASFIASATFYRVRTLDNTLTVTGSATATSSADTARWTVSISRSAYESDVASAQARVSADAKQVADFLTKAGIPQKGVTVSPTYVDREYSSDQNAPIRYTVRLDVTADSDDPHLIEQLAKNISTLASRGVVVSAQMPQYFMSDLPKQRIALIGKAVEDAKARATEIAKSTGRAVGSLQSASGGVVQVLAPNSIDVSDYGNYDTSTIEKKVMVTARATFYLR